MKSKSKSIPSKGNSCYKDPTVILAQQGNVWNGGDKGEGGTDEILEMVTSQVTPGFANQRKEKFDFYSQCDGSWFFLGGGGRAI